MWLLLWGNFFVAMVLVSEEIFPKTFIFFSQWTAPIFFIVNLFLILKMFVF